MTPAETMKSAATLMRDRAEAATCGGMSRTPWRVGEPASCGCCERVTDASGSRIATVDNRQSAHIASMDPLLAAALADLLDKIGEMADLDPDLMGRVGCDEVLKIAQVYLGEAGPQ